MCRNQHYFSLVKIFTVGFIEKTQDLKLKSQENERGGGGEVVVLRF